MDNATTLQLVLAATGGLAALLSTITLARIGDIGKDIKEITGIISGHKTEIELLKWQVHGTPPTKGK